MKTKHIKLAQLAIAIVFVAAIAYFIAGISIDKKTGPAKAQERFDQFMLATSNLAAKYEPNSPEFNRSFVTIMDTATSDFNALQLDVNGTTIYTYPPQGNATSSDLVTSDFSDSTRTVLGNTLTVTASLYALNPFSIYRYAKVSFLLILLGTIAAIVLLLLIQFSLRPNKVQKTRKLRPILTFADDAPDNAAEEATEQTESAQTDTPLPETEDDFDPIGEMEEENKEASEESLLQATAEDEDSIVAEDTIPTDDGDRGDLTDWSIDNSTTPIHSQLSLEAELQQELAEAISDDADLSVLILRIDHFREESPVADQIGALLLEKIGKQGTVFSYNDGYALIIKNTTLDTALATAQPLFTAINHILETNDESGQNAIGIAARSERLLSAKRLITEAEQACLHADDENPIIAFRVNPEKYREYMAQH